MEDIINRVAKSNLKVINLEDYYPAGQRAVVDLKDWLFEGLVLREKEFRAYVKAHDWTQYKDQYVALNCSTDAIIPDWAYMLIALELEPYVKQLVIGNLTGLETAIFQDIISALDLTEFINKPVIIKGCSKKPVPLNAYTLLATKLKPVVKSILFGEACSSVPLYKSKPS